jgi:integrase
LPPSIKVWRSVREHGDTKTKKSRRTLALPQRGLAAMQRHRLLQDQFREQAGSRWQDRDLVFTTSTGTVLDAANVRRAFRRILRAAGLDPQQWTPRELRHSFVSLLSEDGVSIEDIADLCGHVGTTVTEQVYRPPTPPGPARRCGRHGPHPRHRASGVATQIVIQIRREAMSIDGIWPPTVVGGTGIEPVTSSV